MQQRPINQSGHWKFGNSDAKEPENCIITAFHALCITGHVSRFTFYIFGFMVFWGMGCDIERDFRERDFQSSESVAAEINLMLAPAFQAPELRVVIEAKRKGDDGTELGFIPPLKVECVLSDLSPQCSANLDIPIGSDRIIDVMAFAGGDTAAFEGREEVDVVGDRPLPVNISLDPVGVPLLRLKAQSPVVRINDKVSIDIQAKNVNNLFGVALELDYDKNRLSPLEVRIPPDSRINESEFLLFDDLNLTPAPGSMALALTLTDEQEAIEVRRTPETTMTVTFRALSLGLAQVKVRVVKDSSPKLTDASGQELDRIDELRTHLGADDGRRGTVEVTIR